MSPVSSAWVRESGRCVREADLAAGNMSLSRWQPDFVALKFKAQKVAFLELCQLFLILTWATAGCIWAKTEFIWSSS